MQVLEIPAELTHELRRAAVDVYSAELDRAHGLAIKRLRGEDDVDGWLESRAAVRDAGATVSLIGDDLSGADAVEIMLDDRARELLDRLIGEMLIMSSGSLGIDPEPDDVVKAAKLIEQLRVLRGDVTARVLG